MYAPEYPTTPISAPTIGKKDKHLLNCCGSSSARQEIGTMVRNRRAVQNLPNKKYMRFSEDAMITIAAYLSA
jgi:hypothetical protein